MEILHNKNDEKNELTITLVEVKTCNTFHELVKSTELNSTTIIIKLF